MSNLPYCADGDNFVFLHSENTNDVIASMVKTLQVGLLEDHPVFRTGVKLSLAPVCHVVVEAATAREFFKKLQSAHLDVVVLDILLPDASGVDVAQRLKTEYPDIKILVLSVDGREETFEQLVEIGIDGFLSKNASEDKILEAVQAICRGDKYFSRPEEILERDILLSARSTKHEALTERECDIMLAFCKGLSCCEIAQKMGISPKTVDNHKQHIFAKLGIHNIVQLVTYAVRNKIIVLS